MVKTASIKPLIEEENMTNISEELTDRIEVAAFST
jgi:hypothetical protein